MKKSTLAAAFVTVTMPIAGAVAQNSVKAIVPSPAPAASSTTLVAADASPGPLGAFPVASTATTTIPSEQVNKPPVVHNDVGHFLGGVVLYGTNPQAAIPGKAGRVVTKIFASDPL